MNKGDVIAKVIVIVLIAVFLGFSAYTMIAPKDSAAGNAPAGMPSGGSAPGGAAVGGNASTAGQETAQSGRSGGSAPAGTAPGAAGQRSGSGGQGATQSGRSGGNTPAGAAPGAAGQGSTSSGQGAAQSGRSGGNTPAGAAPGASGQRSAPAGQGTAQTGRSGGNAPAGTVPGAAGQRSGAGGNTQPAAQETAQSGRSGDQSAAAGGGSGGSPAGSAAPAGRRQAAAITVSAKTLQPETIRQVVKLNGDVSSQAEVNVMPDTSGKITRIVKNLGDTVRQGEVIAYIDPSRAGQSYSENPVVSPVGGTITSLPLTTGSTVTSSTVVAVIGSLDNLKITIYVAEKYSAYLRRGLPAIVSFASAPGEEFAASVSAISPVVNNKNRTIETTLLLNKRDTRIKQGMFASVHLVIREETKVMVIPRGAVKNYNGEPTVYVIDENSVARRIPVALGLTNDSDAQIVSGLKEGDRVITAGSVTDGSAVRIAGAGLSVENLSSNTN